MNILMLTNIYTPQTGGITRSIQAFTRQFRGRGHHVMIVAPSAKGEPEEEPDVIRFPAIPNAYQNKYSLPLPIPGFLHSTFREFRPDVVHSHHPFLIGSAAQSGAVLWNVPVVYTHHTRYDAYLKTLSRLPDMLADLVVNSLTGYCNLCDAVIAPSRSIEKMLQERGVTTRIEVIPTGVDVRRFARADGAKVRRDCGIPEGAFVVGHVGRLHPEKNCGFLAQAVAEFLRRQPEAHFLLAGAGPETSKIRNILNEGGVWDRCHHLGELGADEVVAVYHAMDVFAFASQSETQGMVLTEAMAAGVPVVAVAASGVTDVMRDGENGRMLPEEKLADFVAALEWVQQLDEGGRGRLREGALQTADRFSITRCADRVVELYGDVIAERKEAKPEKKNPLATPLRYLDYEWKAWAGILEAVVGTLLPLKGGSEGNGDEDDEE